MHVAAETGNEYMTIMLIRKGAVIDARDASGRTPLDAALEKKHSRCAELVRGHAAIARDHVGTRLLRRLDGSPWAKTPSTIPYEIGNRFVGAAHTNLEVVKSMLTDFPSIHALDATWREMGIEACAHTGRTDIVAILAEHGAPVSLATATVLGRIDLVKQFLTEDPASVRERGPHDYPLLAYPALGEGLLPIAELLLKAGVDVNAANSLGTGLHFAARSGNRDLVALYLSHGADKELRRLDDDATARDVALKAGHTAAAAML
jgi:ankyrin repeat protein